MSTVEEKTQKLDFLVLTVNMNTNSMERAFKYNRERYIWGTDRQIDEGFREFAVFFRENFRLLNEMRGAMWSRFFSTMEARNYDQKRRAYIYDSFHEEFRRIADNFTLFLLVSNRGEQHPVFWATQEVIMERFITQNVIDTIFDDNLRIPNTPWGNKLVFKRWLDENSVPDTDSRF